MFVAVGSLSNVAEGMPKKSAGRDQSVGGRARRSAPRGADEANRADVLVFDVGSNKPGKPFATGIRNCVGLAIQPGTGDLWCTVNERDALGDNLVPDYSTRVKEGGYYGWPWYYMGDHEDPRHAGERPDLRAKRSRRTCRTRRIRPRSASRSIPRTRGVRPFRPNTSATRSPCSTARGIAPTARATRSCA